MFGAAANLGRANGSFTAVRAAGRIGSKPGARILLHKLALRGVDEAGCTAGVVRYEPPAVEQPASHAPKCWMWDPLWVRQGMNLCRC